MNTPKQTPLVDILRLHAEDLHNDYGHNKSARLLSQAADEIERLRSSALALEDEKNDYMDGVGDVLRQDHDGETLWAAAQRVMSERDRLRTELAEAKKEIALLKTPNLVWDFNEPEDSSTDSIADGVYQYVDWVGGEEAIGQEVSFLTARKLPNVTVRITSVNDDGEVTFEEIEAALAGGE